MRNSIFSFHLRRLDIPLLTKVSEDGLSHLQKLRLVTTEDGHEFFIERLPIERWSYDKYKERLEKLKFFLCD